MISTSISTIRHMRSAAQNDGRVDGPVDADAQDDLDELDLAIVHALQIDARAPWAAVGAAVGADPATVVRRWSRLQERRLAWFTVWPTPEHWATLGDIAMVRIEPAAADHERAAADVASVPWVLSLDDTSAGLLAIVIGGDGLAAIGERVRSLGTAGRIAEVSIAASVHADDSRWRLGVLSAGQRQQLARPRGAAPAPPRGPAQVEAVAAALRVDARMPFARIADRLDVSEPTARRLVERCIGSGQLRVGCDVAMPLIGLRRGAVLRATARDVDAAAARAARLPERHRVAVLVSGAPLFVGVRMPSLTALPAIERAWGDAVEVLDRWTVLRARKRNGHILDVTGRSTGEVIPQWSGSP